jgi:hypothetical protein
VLKGFSHCSSQKCKIVTLNAKTSVNCSPSIPSGFNHFSVAVVNIFIIPVFIAQNSGNVYSHNMSSFRL